MAKLTETEAGFTAAVIAYAQLHGWRVAHFRPGLTRRGKWVTPVQGDGKGFPDLVCVHQGRGKVVACELKVGRNKTTPEQAAWLAAFSAAGVPGYCWYPRDWPGIEAVFGAGVRVRVAGG